MMRVFLDLPGEAAADAADSRTAPIESMDVPVYIAYVQHEIYSGTARGRRRRICENRAARKAAAQSATTTSAEQAMLMPVPSLRYTEIVEKAFRNLVPDESFKQRVLDFFGMMNQISDEALEFYLTVRRSRSQAQ